NALSDSQRWARTKSPGGSRSSTRPWTPWTSSLRRDRLATDVVGSRRATITRTRGRSRSASTTLAPTSAAWTRPPARAQTAIAATARLDIDSLLEDDLRLESQLLVLRSASVVVELPEVALELQAVLVQIVVHHAPHLRAVVVGDEVGRIVAGPARRDLQVVADQEVPGLGMEAVGVERGRGLGRPMPREIFGEQEEAVVLEDGVHSEDARVEVVHVGGAVLVVALELAGHGQQRLARPRLEVALGVPRVPEGLEHQARVERVFVVVVVGPGGGVAVEDARPVFQLPLAQQAPELDADVAAARELAGEEVAIRELQPVGGGHFLPTQRDLELPHRDLEPLVLARVPIEDEVLERARGAGARLRPRPAQLQLVG